MKPERDAEARVSARVFESERARLESFGEAIDEIESDVEARIGDDDLRRIRRLRHLSRACEVVGRVAIHFSFEPIVFTAGVIVLFVHKQLEIAEIGHSALHGAYDRFGPNTGFHSRSFRWRVPIDDASWRRAHNVRHHGNTNVAGQDADIHFGPIRLTEHTPWQPKHRFQILYALLFFPAFTFLMSTHFTGLLDVWFDNSRGGMDYLTDRSLRTKLRAHVHAFRKYIPYYGYEYLLFPGIAAATGSAAWSKVLLGNWLSEVLRDVYSAAMIFSGHLGEDVAAYPEGHKARGRGAWYERQVLATNNFDVSRPLSVLCGGLDRHIEHHLFPRVAPERLREVSPRVRRACEEHGITYKTASWAATLRKAFAHLADLSRPGGLVSDKTEAATPPVTDPS